MITFTLRSESNMNVDLKIILLLAFSYTLIAENCQFIYKDDTHDMSYTKIAHFDGKKLVNGITRTKTQLFLHCDTFQIDYRDKIVRDDVKLIKVRDEQEVYNVICYQPLLARKQDEKKPTIFKVYDLLFDNKTFPGLMQPQRNDNNKVFLTHCGVKEIPELFANTSNNWFIMQTEMVTINISWIFSKYEIFCYDIQEKCQDMEPANYRMIWTMGILIIISISLRLFEVLIQ